MKAILSVLILMSAFAAFGEDPAKQILRGAGATFPAPLYQRWIKIYEERHRVRIRYDAVGSGEGIHRILTKDVDFGGTDAFLSENELKRAEQEVLHVPTCLGAVVVIYNLPGIPELRLTPDILADIFLGRIINWSHRAIQQANPGVRLPDLGINVVHRSDSSGTTFVFSDYLTRVSPAWKKEVGRGKLVRWPRGIGLQGNPGVSEYALRIPGSVAYMQLNYAKQNKLSISLLRNRAGNYVFPSDQAVSTAAAVDLPADTRITITDSTAEKGYPVSAFTWLLVYREQNYMNRSRGHAKALADFLWWVIHDGQKEMDGLHYAPLSAEAVHAARKMIRSMTYNGEPLLPAE